MKSKGLTPERLEIIKKIITEQKEKDARAAREWESNKCEECAQPLRDCLCDEDGE
jgi:DTW domain-containing protein YfiP